MDILIPMRRTVVTASAEMRVPFACKHCDFKAVARVVGKGSAETHSTLAFLPAPRASAYQHHEAHESAAADGSELLRLITCPRCGKRDPDAWGSFNRVTRILQAITGVVVFGSLAALWIGNPGNPAIAVICAIPGAFCIFLVGFLRDLRTEMPADRVTFLSPEDLAAETAAAEAAADKALRKQARAEKRREEAANQPAPRRARVRPAPSEPEE